MEVLLGLDINEAQFEHWSTLLVNDYAPYFLTSALAEQLQTKLFLLDRSEYKQCALSQSHSDSYAPYQVEAEATYIAYLSAADLAKLPENDRSMILQEQIHLERGQVYLWKDIAQFVEEIPVAHTWRINEAFILDASVWWLLSAAQRKAFLCQFMKDGQKTCISKKLSQTTWERIAYQDDVSLQHFLGWEMQSGANCFASTLAVAKRDFSIARLWLHQKDFFRGLAETGYQRQEALDPFSNGLKNAVLVWEDSSGQAQHSAFLLDEQILVNKDSQAWYSPRQLIYLKDLIEHWQDEAYQIMIYAQI